MSARTRCIDRWLPIILGSPSTRSPTTWRKCYHCLCCLPSRDACFAARRLVRQPLERVELLLTDRPNELVLASTALQVLVGRPDQPRALEALRRELRGQLVRRQCRVPRWRHPLLAAEAQALPCKVGLPAVPADLGRRKLNRVTLDQTSCISAGAGAQRTQSPSRASAAAALSLLRDAAPWVANAPSSAASRSADGGHFALPATPEHHISISQRYVYCGKWPLSKVQPQ